MEGSLMDIVCSNCKTKLSIPDHKVPKGQKASFLCPKCKYRIQILPASQGELAGEYGQSKPSNQSKTASRKYDAADKPFDFVDDGRQTSLVCLADGAAATAITTALEVMGYVVKSAGNVEQALLNMRYHLFDVVVVDDGFDPPGEPGVLDYFCQLEMVSRRRIFVVLIARQFRTMDNMSAFHQSVNLVINPTSLDEVEKILVRGIQEHEDFYAVFNDSLKETGKA